MFIYKERVLRKRRENALNDVVNLFFLFDSVIDKLVTFGLLLVNVIEQSLVENNGNVSYASALIISVINPTINTFRYIKVDRLHLHHLLSRVMALTGISNMYL